MDVFFAKPPDTIGLILQREQLIGQVTQAETLSTYFDEVLEELQNAITSKLTPKPQST